MKSIRISTLLQLFLNPRGRDLYSKIKGLQVYFDLNVNKNMNETESLCNRQGYKQLVIELTKITTVPEYCKRFVKLEDSQ